MGYSDVDRKLGRAEHHRDDLANLIAQYRRNATYRVDERTDESGGKPYKVVFAHSLGPVPEDAALIFGDVVQNLRATLDYLIGELRPQGPTGSSQFPICAAPESFDSARRSQLSGVPASAIATIERMQAYGPDPDRGAFDQWPEELKQRELYRPLRWLQTLWNVDKHRALAVASGFVIPDWASHNRVGEDSGIAFRIDRSKGQAEVWVPLDERDDFLDAHFGVSVSLMPPPRAYKADWPTGIIALELDGLAESLWWVVRWSVLRELGEYRVA